MWIQIRSILDHIRNPAVGTFRFFLTYFITVNFVAGHFYLKLLFYRRNRLGDVQVELYALVEHWHMDCSSKKIILISSEIVPFKFVNDYDVPEVMSMLFSCMTSLITQQYLS